MCVETNRYWIQTLDERAKDFKAKQINHHEIDKTQVVERGRVIRARLRSETAFEPQEVCVVVGFLIANVLVPQVRGIHLYWGLTVEGALPALMFGRYMACNRFMELMRNLHFVNNSTYDGVAD